LKELLRKNKKWMEGESKSMGDVRKGGFFGKYEFVFEQLLGG